MSDNRAPLHYAIIKCFVDGLAHDSSSILEQLKPDYGGYKLFTRKDIEEALATAKENGLLEEHGYSLNGEGGLVVHYAMTNFGSDMVNRYIGA